jgi:hypothetical protein
MDIFYNFANELNTMNYILLILYINKERNYDLLELYVKNNRYHIHHIVIL